MGLFGPSKAELRARAEEAEREREALKRATRRPAWRRALSAVPWWLAVVLVATVGPPVAAFVAARLTVRAWIRWPRLVTGVGAVPWAVFGGPWWGALPLSLVTVAAVAWDIHMHPAPPVEAAPDRDVATWRTLVAGGDAPLLPGSVVADHASPVFTPDGRRCGRTLHVSFRDARQTRAAAHQARAGIAALWRTHESGVACRDLRDESRVDVEVLDAWWLDELAHDAAVDDAAAQARLREVHLWRPGHALDLASGRLTLAVAARTGAPVEVQVFVPGEGALHFWFVGATRRGKSSALSSFIASVMSTGVARLHLIDMKGGSSLPEWVDHAETYAGTADGDDPLADARTVIRHIRRNVLDPKVKAMGEARLKVVNPSPEWPIDLVVIEEAVDLTGDREIMGHVDAMARKGGSALLIVVWVTQVGNADRAFGSAGTGMREQLQAGTVVSFWCGPTTRRLSLGDSDIDLSSIPLDVKGATVISSQGAGQVLARTLRIPDDDAVGLADRIAAAVGLGRPGGPLTVDVLRGEAASVPSGGAGTVPVVGLTEAEAAIAAAFGGPGRAMSTGEVLTAAGMPSSTFHAARRRLEAAGQLVSQGHGQWVATAALYERTGV